jgi:hypothetical protein
MPGNERLREFSHYPLQQTFAPTARLTPKRSRKAPITPQPNGMGKDKCRSDAGTLGSGWWATALTVTGLPHFEHNGTKTARVFHSSAALGTHCG